MKAKTKQLTVIIALLLLCTAILPCIYGCTKKNSNRFDTELFSCMYNKEKTGVIILELTEKGQEQEILVVPEEINGLPVVQLGGVTGYPNHWHHVESQKAKKVYFPFSFVATRKVGILSFPNATVVVMGLGEEKNRDELAHIYTRDLIECNRYIFDYSVDKEKIKKQNGSDAKRIDLCEDANVQFILRGEVKYIDYINEGEVYLRPDEYDPSLGMVEWYLDEQYKNLWNREYMLTDGNLCLYGKQFKGE